MKNTSNTVTMAKGREAFRQYIDNEKNPVKQEQLKEYIPYIDKARDLRELSWYFRKALEEAAAKDAFLSYQQSAQAEKEARVKKWKIKLIFLWAALALVSVFTIWKGFQPFYVYTMADGSEITSDVYEGGHITAGTQAEPLQYSHKKFEFSEQPFVRIMGVLIGVISLSLLSYIKMQ